MISIINGTLFCVCCICSTRSYFVDHSGRGLGATLTCCYRATNHYDDWYQCNVQLRSLLCWIHYWWKVEVDLPIKSASVTGRKMTAQGPSAFEQMEAAVAEPGKKKQYKCGECGMTGHTRKTCQFCAAMNRYCLQHLFNNFFCLSSYSTRQLIMSTNNFWHFTPTLILL